MPELRMASPPAPWLAQRIRSNPPMSPRSPKRGRWRQAAPEIELTSPLESPTTAMTQAVQLAAEATTQVVPQAGKPKTSILDELLGAAAPTSAPTVALASLAGGAESNRDSDEGRPDGAEKDKTGPDQCQAEQREREQGRSAVDRIGKPPEGSGSAESGAQAAAPAAAAPAGRPGLNPEEVLNDIEDEVDLL